MKFLTHKGVLLAGRTEVEKFDWRASTRQVRNEQYSAAIWFWRRRKEQLASGFSGWFNFQPAPAQNL
jgi:sulfoquinovosyltransferase